MSATAPQPIAVRMASITKRYPTVIANHRASIEVRRGEVHAIVGENGAGKSTLMKVLYGLVPPDEGEIEVLGRRLVRHSPRDAIEAGLGMVFQHFMLVPNLSVAENVVLGVEPRRGGVWFDRRCAVDEVRRVSSELALPIDPDALIESCSVGLQQRVEILKVLLRGAEVIILDEPTAVLTPQEVDELIGVMRRLVGQGKTIILITHKLREVMAAADRVTIMRRGESIETLDIKATSAGEIAEKMIGRALEVRARPAPSEVEKRPVLEIDHLTVAPRRGGVADLSLRVSAGEIVGVAGIEGNGQSELVECIAGLIPTRSGTIRFEGREIQSLSVRDRGDLGIAHVPEDRLRRGVVLDFTLEENAALGLVHRRELSSRWSLRFATLRAHVERVLRDNDVRPPDPTVLIRQLSGGNQQKLVVGRELSRRPRLLLACHPSRGLDIGASEFVHRSLLAERQRGAAVLLVSAELSELLAVCDRIVVMSEGRLVGEVDPRQVDERRLGLMMAGHAA
ncbi:MAG: ABC transporter ATP-binding protein [Deltaproteobacteria bacterium]|nr:ABC transporter ATP-binding protein [Deltaproteobacteria bacterium]